MYKIIISLVFVVLYVNETYSQSMEQVAKNQVSESITVYTYKLMNVSFEEKNMQSDNDQNNASLNEREKDFINRFTLLEEVSEATFDRATKTVTVYTSTNAALPITIDLKRTK